MIKPYYENPFGKLYHGDCLDIMKELDMKFDLVLTDPPYGTTKCKWDSVITFDKMWNALKEVTEDVTPIVLFGSEPFSSALRMSNINSFRYDWYWGKDVGGGFLNANKQPLRNVETISVFYRKQCVYNPQKTQGVPNHGRKASMKKVNTQLYNVSYTVEANLDGMKFPKQILTFSKHSSNHKLHPTQKPVALLEYLIKTYTNENQLVLDFTCGSGSTGVACINTNRNFVLIEKEEKYCEVSAKRLEEAYQANLSEIDL